MAKPEWKDAPHWANWLAQDEVDYYWVWFENKPTKMQNGWIDRSPDGKWLQTKDVATKQEWRKTLEQRP